MEATKNKAVDKLFYTEDRHTEKFRQETTLNFFEGERDQDISLPITAYLEKKHKTNEGNLALGVANTQNFDILALEMDTKETDRVAVSISSMGAIYGLWFKRDDVYVNSSISVGASFRESVVLTGLLLEAALLFGDDVEELKTTYEVIVDKISKDEEITNDLTTFTALVKAFARDFVWLNNSGDISYRELYIHSLPYTSLVTTIIDDRDNFILYSTEK